MIAGVATLARSADVSACARRRRPARHHGRGAASERRGRPPAAIRASAPSGAPRTTEAAFTGLARSGAGWATADGYVPGRAPRRPHRVADVRHVAGAAGGRRRRATDLRAQQHRGAARPLPHRGARRDGRRPAAISCPRSTGARAGRARASPRGRTLLVFCTLVETADGPPGFGFRVVGTAIATFSCRASRFTAVAPAPVHRTRRRVVGLGRSARRRHRVRVRRGRGNAYVACVSPFDRVTTGPWRSGPAPRGVRRDALAPMTFPGGTPARPPFVTAIGRGLRRGRVPGRAPRPDHRGMDGVRDPRVPGVPVARWPPRAATGQFAYDARASTSPASAGRSSTT